MTLAFTAPGVGLIAADTRYVFETEGVHDFGQRIRRVPQGWAAATGDVHVALLALRAAERGLGDIDAAWQAVQLEHARVIEWADPIGAGVLPSMLAVVRESAGGFQIHGITLEQNGYTFARPHTSTGYAHAIIAWPVGITTSQANHLNPEWEKRLATSSSIPELLREVARAFEHGRTNGRHMSDEVEIGITCMREVLQLRARTEWIIGVSDQELVDALHPPAQYPPFPQLESERFVFEGVSP